MLKPRSTRSLPLRFRLAIVPLLLWPSVRSAHAQDALNLGFEDVTESNASAQWQTGGTRPLETDSEIHMEGGRSLRLTLGEATLAVAQLALPTPASGAVARLEASVRTEGLDGVVTPLIVLADAVGRLSMHGLRGPVDPLAITPEAGLVGSPTWQTVSVEVQVPPSTQVVGLAALAAGRAGTIWFDDLHLTLDGQPYAADTPSEVVLDERAAWLRSAGAPLSLDNGHLARLVRSATDAEVVGLGEATHGTLEFTLLRRQLVEALATDRPIVLALEANVDDVIDLDRVVQGGSGKIREALRNTFAIWNTDEMADLFAWMREANRADAGHLLVRGVDIQNPVAAARVAAGSAAGEACGAGEVLEETRRTWPRIGVPGTSLSPDDEQAIRHWHETAETLSHCLDGAGALPNVRDAALLITQAAEYAGAPASERGAVRDSILARRVLSVREASPGALVVWWAHNAHTSVVRGGAGGYLRDDLGRAYLSVGTVLFGGAFSAFGSEGWLASPLEPAAPFSLGGLFERAFGEDALVLTPSSHEAAGDWFWSPVPIRTAGQSPSATYQRIEPGDAFDALLFVRTSTPSHSF